MKKIISIITVALLIAVIISVNIVAYFLPTSITHIDTTKEKLFTLSDWTKQTLSGLNEKIEIYFLCLNGIEDENIYELLCKYEALSDSINVTVKDTAVYPEFYADYSDTELTDNSLIIESQKRFICIDYNDIYQYDSSSYSFDGEGQITSGINYVVTDNLPKMYILEGHEEAALSEELITLVKKENIITESINLNGHEKVPDDADCILINSPKRDISEMQLKLLESYMSNGGKLMVLWDYKSEPLPVFESFLTEYGIKINKGLVFEQNSTSYVPSYPYFIYPIEQPHAITNPIINAKLDTLFPLCSAVTFTQTENITINELITSTDSAYSKVDINSENLGKEEGDISGPFAFALEITDNRYEKQSNMVFYSTSQFIDTNINSMVGNANYDLFLNSLSALCNSEPTTTIRSKDMLSASIAVSELASNIMFFVLIVILPFTLIITGITVVYFRKTK